jgi:hypothetical protein
MAFRSTAIALAVPGRPGRACEDAAGCSTEQDAVTVADGLGSARMGSLGSHTAVNLALGPIREALMAGLEPARLPALLAGLWEQDTHGDHDVATTCLFAVATPDRLVLAQLGDGLAMAIDHEGREHRLPGGRGQFGNHTEALPRGILQVASHPVESIDAVLLATDGVSDDLVPGSEARLAAELARIAREQGAAALEARLEQWLTNWATPASHDDRSIGLLLFDPTNPTRGR